MQKIFHLFTAIIPMEIWYQCVEPSEWWHFSFEMTIRGALIRYFTFTLNRTFSNIQLSLNHSQKSSYSFGATSADASRHIHFNKLQKSQTSSSHWSSVNFNQCSRLTPHCTDEPPYDYFPSDSLGLSTALVITAQWPFTGCLRVESSLSITKP